MFSDYLFYCEAENSDTQIFYLPVPAAFPPCRKPVVDIFNKIFAANFWLFLRQIDDSQMRRMCLLPFDQLMRR